MSDSLSFDSPESKSSEKNHQSERARVKHHLSRARAFGTDATLTTAEWLEILDHHDWKCMYCKGPYEVLEHCIPIRAGGGTTADNCVPACISCNNRKVDRLVIYNLETNSINFIGIHDRATYKFLTIRQKQGFPDSECYWFTTSQLLDHLKRTSNCEEINSGIIDFMVQKGLLTKRCTDAGDRYRFG